jgi:hypothetical protein
MAVQNEHIDCVRTLVRCGADVLIQRQGKSLGDIADRTNMADALKAALCVPAECDKTTSAKLQNYSACRKVYYCNPKCQLAHWLQHKLVCNVAE